jgi:transposase
VLRLDDALKAYLHREPIGCSAGSQQAGAAGGQFSNRRRNRVKILGWERNGFWLLLKRLEKDRFVWPDLLAVPTLTVEQLHWLLEGIDIGVVQRHPQRVYARV